MNIQKLKISEITPYWRNPRNNDEEAINAVVESIKEYGYQSPIIVDTKHVIIAGDTRYKALLRMGYDEIQVLVSDMDEDRARGYRIIDNKTSEKATWDWEKLIPELRAFKNLAKFEAHFPDLHLKPINMDVGKIDEASIQARQKELEQRFTNVVQEREEKRQEMLCPHCGETFEIL